MQDSILCIPVFRSCALGTAGIGKDLILFSVSLHRQRQSEVTVLERLFLSKKEFILLCFHLEEGKRRTTSRYIISNLANQSKYLNDLISTLRIINEIEYFSVLLSVSLYIFRKLLVQVPSHFPVGMSYFPY